MTTLNRSLNRLLNRHRYVVGFCLFVGGAIALPATGDIAFGLLGVTPEDPAWALVLGLGGLLMLIALRLPLEQWRCGWADSDKLGWLGKVLHQQHFVSAPIADRIATVLLWLSRLATGGLLGFFYGGRWTGDDWFGAIAGLITGLVLALVAGRWGERNTGMLEPRLAGAIAFWAAYSLWLWCAAWGLSALMAQRWLLGGRYGLMALVFARWAWSGWFWLVDRR